MVAGSDLHEKLPISGANSEVTSEPSSIPVSATSSAVFPNLSDSSPVVVVLGDTDKPMVSTSIKQATKHTPIHVLDNKPKEEDTSKVKFLLGKNFML